MFRSSVFAHDEAVSRASLPSLWRIWRDKSEGGMKWPSPGIAVTATVV